MPAEGLQPITDSKLSTLKEAVRRYHSAAFLAEEWFDARGVSEESRNTFRLGLCEDPIPGHEQYEGMICIPYLDSIGRVLKVRFRRLSGDGPKYMDLPHEHSRMFNTKAILNADRELHATEGEIDAIILEQLGYHAVALPGATQWQKHHPKMLAGFERIYAWGDPDSAGAEFNERILTSMRQAQAVKLNEDVNDLFLSAGAEGVHRAKESVIW